MTDQPKATDKYLKTLEEELETSRVFKKAKELEVEMNTFLKEGKGTRTKRALGGVLCSVCAARCTSTRRPLKQPQ